MIIACPACSTRYVVPDSAIGVDGRTVRCAKCRHSWFQVGPDLALRPEPADAPAPAMASPPHAPEPAPTPVVARGSTSPPPARAATRKAAASDPDTGPSPFAHEPPFRPRRNPARLWTAAGVAFATLVFGLIGAATWFGLPGWIAPARPLFGSAHPDLVLSFPAERQDRHPLSNGTNYYGVSGTVTNLGKDVREVPPILIVLRDAQNRVVYTANVTPPRDVLKPGESETINEALGDVPKTAKVAVFGWKPE